MKYFAEPLPERRLILLILLLLAARLGAYALVAGNLWQLPASLCQFDCFMLLHTAQDGYDYVPNATPGVNFGLANWVNFPVFPMMIFITARIFDLTYNIAGFIAANLSLCGFAYLAAKYLALTGSLSRAALVLFLFAFPFGFYFSLVYTEAIYALLTMAAFYAYRRRRIFGSSVFAGLLSATRVTGILFAPIIAVHYLRDAYGALRRGQTRQAAGTLLFACFPVAIAPFGMFAFMLFLYLHMGDALAFFHVQRAWGRSEGNPFAAIVNGLFAGDLGSTFGKKHSSEEFSAFAASIGLVVSAYLLAKQRYAECWFLAASILLAVSAGLNVFFRYLLANPIFLLVLFEIIWLPKLRRAFPFIIVLCLAAQLFLIHLWVRHYGSLI